MISVNEDYFMKYLKNELTEDETRQLVAWLRDNKENQKFLFSLKDSYLYLNMKKIRKKPILSMNGRNSQKEPVSLQNQLL